MGGLRYVLGEPDRPPARGRHLDRRLAAPPRTRASARWRRCRSGSASGRGQVVDSAIYEAVLAMMESLVTEWQVAGYQRERTGAILPEHRTVQRVPDRRRRLGAHRRQPGLGVPPAGRARWASPELADDPRYATHGARGANQAELDERIAALVGPARRRHAAVHAGRRGRAGRPHLPAAGHARATRT